MPSVESRISTGYSKLGDLVSRFVQGLVDMMISETDRADQRQQLHEAAERRPSTKDAVKGDAVARHLKIEHRVPRPTREQESVVMSELFAHRRMRRSSEAQARLRERRLRQKRHERGNVARSHHDLFRFLTALPAQACRLAE
jgi:hypothetical protein